MTCSFMIHYGYLFAVRTSERHLVRMSALTSITGRAEDEQPEEAHEWS